MAARRVVAINHKGDILCCCDSIREFCKLNGVSEHTVHSARRHNAPFRCMKLIDEEIYRKHWMEGTTAQLGFRTLKQRYLDRARKICENMSEAVKKQKNGKIKAKQQERVRKGLNHLVNNRLRCRKVLCIQTETTYPSMKDAAKAIGVSPSSISQSVRHGTKSNGKNFKYI